MGGVRAFAARPDEPECITSHHITHLHLAPLSLPPGRLSRTYLRTHHPSSWPKGEDSCVRIAILGQTRVVVRQIVGQRGWWS